MNPFKNELNHLIKLNGITIRLYSFFSLNISIEAVLNPLWLNFVHFFDGNQVFNRNQLFLA